MGNKWQSPDAKTKKQTLNEEGKKRLDYLSDYYAAPNELKLEQLMLNNTDDLESNVLVLIQPPHGYCHGSYIRPRMSKS